MNRQEELADLDEIIAAGEEALAELRVRRRFLLDDDLPHLKEIARLLHQKECFLQHEDQCAFGYEEGWMREPGNPLAADVWTSTIRAHHRWLEAARARVDKSGRTASDFLDMLRIVSR